MSKPSWAVVVTFVLIAALVGAAAGQAPGLGPSRPLQRDPRLTATEQELLIQLLDRVVALQSQVAQLRGQLDDRVTGLGGEIAGVRQKLVHHCHKQNPEYGDLCGPS